MLLTRIEKIGDSAALLLTDEMLKLLNIFPYLKHFS